MNGKCTHKRAYAQIWTDMNRYWQIWTYFRNMYQTRWMIFTAESAQRLGLLHTPGRSWDRFRVWIREFWSFEERTGRPFLRTNLKLNFFFWKIKFFFEKLSFWIWTDMHRYAQICTDMHIYAQIQTYKQI